MGVNQKVRETLVMVLKDSRTIFKAEVEVFTKGENFSEVIQILASLFMVTDDALCQEVSLARPDIQTGRREFIVKQVAGVILKDLVESSWQTDVPAQVQQGVVQAMIQMTHEDYSLRNLQARILSTILVKDFPNIWEQKMERLVDHFSGDDENLLDMSLRAITFFMEAIEDEQRIKKLHEYVSKILPHLFSAFTNDEFGAKSREKILMLFYHCLRSTSWADGVDNELVEECLGETFSSWMALFVQIIQTNPRTYFNIKRNALMCLTIIFRDYINYSRESINAILQPAWKLLNFHLPIFTEALGYRVKVQDANNEGADQDLGFESEEDSDVYGIEGMTLCLIDLLASLACRPSVKELVRQGMVPLATTISSFMILTADQENSHIQDPAMFIHEKDEDVYKIRSIRNSCIDLLSSLIESFGDDAVTSILTVVESLFLNTKQPISPQKQQQPSTDESFGQGSIDDVNVLDFSYESKNPKHFWKKREVALYIVGSFWQDIKNCRVRQTGFDLKEIVQNISETNFHKAQLRSYLKGRTLWCAIQFSEVFKKEEQTQIVEMIKMAVDFMHQEKVISVKLAGAKTIVKFTRKLNQESKEEALKLIISIVDDLEMMLRDKAYLDNLILPIEAIGQISRMNEEIVAKIAPQTLPILLNLFRSYHQEGFMGHELLNLFKLWCQYDKCRDIFVTQFLPFIMEIVETFFNSTPNIHNVTDAPSLQNKLQVDNRGGDGEQQNVVDSTILMHSLDLLSTLLRRSPEGSADHIKIISVFPKLLKMVKDSEDMFLLLHGLNTIKTFIFLGSKQVLKVSSPKDIIEVVMKFLQPATNENSCMSIGNFVIQVFHKIQPKIDTNILMGVVQKVYKSRMPSIIQSLILVYARLIHSNPKEIIEFLSDTSIDSRISLKIVLDKWLLQQPLFRGQYTKAVTFSALIKLFNMRDSSIESLMVIGYNPSHSNVNSEVNAPFKILSIMMRFLESENSPKKGHRKPPDTYEPEDEEEKGITPGYKMRRDLMAEERLDTYGEEHEYGDEDQDDMNALPVDLDDIQDDDDNESLLGQNSGSTAEDKNFFTIKEGGGGGLGDLDGTASEVYMSELLAGFDMEDFDEAEEQNEEDLMELKDSFADIPNLRDFVTDSLNDFVKTQANGLDYMLYCIKQLNKEDADLAKKYLKLTRA